MRRNVGARPWQILFEPRPEPVLSEWEAFQEGEMMPPWQASTIGETVYIGPRRNWDEMGTQAKRISRAVAVDMASAKLRPFDSDNAVAMLQAIEHYTELLISYPYAGSQRRAKEVAANEIIAIWNRWTPSGALYEMPPEFWSEELAPWAVRSAAIAACVAAVHLARNETPDGAIPASIAALNDFALGGGREGTTMRWPFRYYGEASEFESDLNYWIRIWWEEVKNVLAFKNWDKRLL